MNRFKSLALTVALLLVGASAHAQKMLMAHPKYAVELLSQIRVQDELAIPGDNRKKLNESVAKLRQIKIEVTDGDDPQKQMQEAMESHDKAIEQMLEEQLTEPQRKRFLEINLQAAGVRGLLWDSVRSDLEITASQVDQLMVIQTELDEATQEIYAEYTTESGDGRIEVKVDEKGKLKLRELGSKLSEKALAKLTVDQKKKWATMVGKPFKFGEN